MCHGSVPCSARERTTVANSQVRMISWACGRRSIGNTRANRSGSVSQPPTICGDSDEVAQVSITSGSPMKPPGCPRCASVKPAGTSEDGSTGRSADSAGVAGARSPAPVVVEPVPHRERHPEEALPADQPVAGEAAHPVLVPVSHVDRHPAQLAARRRAVPRAVRVAPAVAHVPLPAAHDLQRRVALLVELHRVRDRPRLTDQIARCTEELDDAGRACFTVRPASSA